MSEVMDYYAVITVNQEMMGKPNLFKNKIMDGHATYLLGKDLIAYSLAGIVANHDCCDFEYAMKKEEQG
jgi:adenine deaminase